MKRRTALMLIVILISIFTPGLESRRADAAGSTSTDEVPSATYFGNESDLYSAAGLSDNNPPVGSFTIVEGAATNASTIHLSVTGSDPDAGDSVSEMRFANNSVNLATVPWLPFSNTATFSLTGGDGSKMIYMQLKDSNGGISANSSQIILLDQTAPIGTLIINSGATWSPNNTVTLRGTYTDGSGSGVDQARISNISGSWPTSWINVADLNGMSWVLPAGEGAKTVYVQYKDKVGNTSTETISSTIAVDTIAPIISNVVNGKSYNNKVTAVFNEGMGFLNGSLYTSGTEIIQEGAYTLIVTDPAGNSATVSFRIDRTAPIVTGVTNGGKYNSNVTIVFNEGTATLNGAAFSSGSTVTMDGVYTLVVTDAAGNVTIINFEIGKMAPVVTGVTNGGIYNKKVTVSFNEGTATLNGSAFTSGTEIDQDGTYTLVVTGAGGNVTTIKFLMDTSAPTGNVIIQSGAEWTNERNVVLVLTSDDGSEGSGVVEMRFSSNGTDWSNWEPSALSKVWNLEAGDGVKKVFVQFRDKAGNVSDTVITDSIKLDQTIPYGTIMVNGGTASTSSKSVKLNLTSSDGGGSGVAEMRFSTDALTWSEWEKVSSIKDWDLNGDYGSKKLYVEFRDVAGNLSAASMAVIEYQASSGSNNNGGHSGSTGGAGSTTNSSSDKGGSTSPITSTNGKLTLPAGIAGQVSLDEAIVISIPVHAITEKLELAIEKVLNTQNLLNKNEILASSVYEVLKNFQANFNKPVTLTISFDPMKLNNNQTVAIFYYDEAAGVWVKVNGGKISGNRISVEVDHFTKYAVLVVDKASGLPVTEPSIDATTEVSLNDIAGHWAEANIKQAVSNGIVQGYADDTFKPNATVTRAEFAVMLMNTMNSQETGAELSFADKAKIGAWAEKAVAQAVHAGVINGYDDNTFRPNAQLTRAEMATILANSLKLWSESNSATGFADEQIIPSWAKGAVAALNKLGILEGKGMNKFDSNATTTRAEAVTVLLKMLIQTGK